MFKRIGTSLSALALVLVGFVTVVTPANATPIYTYYATGQDTLTNPADGIAVSMDVAKPGYNSAGGDLHTLMEITAQSANTNQTIELGWLVDQQQGDVNPHLFSGAWVNGVFQGYNAAGGFVSCSPPTSGCGTVHPGDTLAYPALKYFGILHQGTYPTGKWWLNYDHSYVGYYPDSIWSSASVTPNFDKVTFTQGFGEVRSSVSSAPCAQMGNGLPASNTGAARIASLTFTGSTDTPSYWLLTPSSPYTSAFNAVTTTKSIRVGGDGNTSC